MLRMGRVIDCDVGLGLGWKYFTNLFIKVVGKVINKEGVKEVERGEEELRSEEKKVMGLLWIRCRCFQLSPCRRMC